MSLKFAKQQVIHSSVNCQSNKISPSTESDSVVDIRVQYLFSLTSAFESLDYMTGKLIQF